MKSLKELSEIERLRIVHQCSTFFLAAPQNDHFSSVHKEFSTVVKGCSKEIWLIINAITRALKRGRNGSELSLRPTNYISANTIHNQGISYRRSVRVVDALDDNGYIEFYKGYGNSAEDYQRSCFLFTPKLRDLFVPETVNKYVSNKTNKQPIEIRDEDGNFVSFGQGLKGSGVVKEEVTALNELLGKHKISFLEIYPFVEYQRIYLLNLNGAGRFYGGSFQTTPSKYRPLMKIDGCDTVELDFSSQHAMILYSMEGIKVEPSFTPYWVNKTVDEVSDSTWRLICKTCLLCLLNAKSRRSASMAVYNKIKNEVGVSDKYSGVSLTQTKVTDIMKAIESHNEKIAHRFYEDRLWAKLQNMDSEILRVVVKEFVKREKPIYLYHDSAVCLESDMELLERSMSIGWELVTGTSYNCRITLHKTLDTNPLHK